MKLLDFFAAAAILWTGVVPTANAQSATTAPGALEIERMLLAGSGEWISVWTPTGNQNWESPAGTGLARFEKREGRIYEVFENRLMGQVCTNDSAEKPSAHPSRASGRTEERLK